MDGWTTADYALIVSLFSAFIAVASFGWNVWSKFIFPRPKVKVSCSIVYTHRPSGHIAAIRRGGTFAGDFPAVEMSDPAISINVINFGPGVIIVDRLAGLPRTGFWRQKKLGAAIVTPYEGYPFCLHSNGILSGGLPKKLEPGEEHQLYVPVTAELTNRKQFTKLGVRDTYCRFHWASAGDMRSLRKLGAEVLGRK